MSDLLRLQTQFEDLTRFIEEACISAQQGRPENMQNLERSVSALCAEVGRAGGQTAKEIQPHMARMISKLDELAQILSQQTQ